MGTAGRWVRRPRWHHRRSLPGASATVGAHSSAIETLAMGAAAIGRPPAGFGGGGGGGGHPVHYRAVVITTGLDQLVGFWSLENAEGTAASWKMQLLWPSRRGAPMHATALAHA